MSTIEALEQNVSSDNLKNKSYSSEKYLVKVLVGGFPLGSKISKIRNFMSSILNNQKFTVIIDNKNCFRGFVFVNFETLGEAVEFTQKEISYIEKNLDIKIIDEQMDFIVDSIENLKEPKKVYVSKLPKTMTKSNLTNLFKLYGTIKDVIIIDRKDREKNFAYVNFHNTDSARSCVSNIGVQTENGSRYPAYFANPIFSKKMLGMIHPLIRKYILEVQNHGKCYSPTSFGKVYENVVNMGEDLVKNKETESKLKKVKKVKQVKNPKIETNHFVKKDNILFQADNLESSNNCS